MFSSSRKLLAICGVIVLLLLLGVVAAAATPSLRRPTQSGNEPANNAPAAISSPVDNTFTYQGVLENDAAPVNDTCDFRFSLWDAAEGGSQIGANDHQQLPVSDGAFTAVLNADGDLGDAPFDGQARWLEIHVRCPAGSGNYMILAPRQPLTPTPYALSLRPGATISGTVPAQRGALNLAGDNHGLLVTNAGGDGVQVCATGSETTCSPHDGSNNGLEVGSAEDMGVLVDSAHTGIFLGSMREDGLYVAGAADDGMRIFEAGGTGISVNHAGGDGFFVCSTGAESTCPSRPTTTNNGLEIGSAEHYGIFVDSAGEAGLLVGSALGGVIVDQATYGVIVGSAEDDGMSVWSAGADGVYASTRNNLGEWGFNTPDKIQASGFVMQTMTLVAQVGGDTPLQPGHLVGAVGVAGPCRTAANALPPSSPPRPAAASPASSKAASSSSPRRGRTKDRPQAPNSGRSTAPQDPRGRVTTWP